MSEASCTIQSRDAYGNIAAANDQQAQFFVGVVRNRNKDNKRISGTKVTVKNANFALRL